MEMKSRLVALMFPLTAYHANHGQYPHRLDDLKPKYAKTIPADLFTGKPLHYRRADNGYLLYSLGRNGKDDGGKEGDNLLDIVVQVP